jgi:hypothetical protein
MKKKRIISFSCLSFDDELQGVACSGSFVIGRLSPVQKQKRMKGNFTCLSKQSLPCCHSSTVYEQRGLSERPLSTVKCVR